METKTDEQLDAEDKRICDRMHELRKQIVAMLSELSPDERSAVVYTLTLEPGIKEGMPKVIAQVIMDQLNGLRQGPCDDPTCAACVAKRAKVAQA